MALNDRYNVLSIVTGVCFVDAISGCNVACSPLPWMCRFRVTLSVQTPSLCLWYSALLTIYVIFTLSFRAEVCFWLSCIILASIRSSAQAALGPRWHGACQHLELISWHFWLLRAFFRVVLKLTCIRAFPNWKTFRQSINVNYWKNTQFKVLREHEYRLKMSSKAADKLFRAIVLSNFYRSSLTVCCSYVETELAEQTLGSILS